jgi:serine/threonine protein kinase
MIMMRPLFPYNSNDAMLIAIGQMFGFTALFDAFPQFCDSPIFVDDLKNSEPKGLKSVLTDCDEELLELAGRLLDVNPNTRITAKDALAMPIFREQRDHS